MQLGKDHLDLDLNLLTALDALLQEQSVTRAAERVGMSQPAMSRSLKRLRYVLKDPLLVRVGNTLYPTAYAGNLIGPVRELMDGIEGLAARRPRFDPETDARLFNVSTSDYATLVALQPIAEILTDRAPGVSLRITNYHDGALEQLQHAELDLVISGPRDGHGLPSRELIRDRVMCAVWGNNSEVQEPLSLEQFLSRPRLVGLPAGYGLIAGGTHFEDACDLPGASTFRTEGSFILPFLMDGTSYVTLLPELLGKRLGQFVSIRMYEPPFPVAPIALHMAWHPRSDGDPAHIWLRDLIAEVVADEERILAAGGGSQTQVGRRRGAYNSERALMELAGQRSWTLLV
jgi:DNA-binding transcriptional LysR family regulator